MKLNQHISIPEISALELPAMSADLPDSALRREVKIYKVPEIVSADQYFVSVTEAGGSEVVPPSRSKNTRLLARYTLGPDNETSIAYLHEEVKNNA